MMPLVLLAGGLATRMRPYTEKIPKSMLAVAGRPFIAHQLTLLAKNNITDIVICVGHLGEKIMDYVQDGAAFGVTVRYVCDGEKALGTGGAALKAAATLPGAFFILYGDAYLTINYARVADAYACCKKIGLMTIYRNEDRFDTSNVVYHNGVIRHYSKNAPIPAMHHIDYGLGILRVEAFEGRTPGETFDLAEIYETLIRRGELAGFEAAERFYEIGSQRGLAELDALMSSKGAAL